MNDRERDSRCLKRQQRGGLTGDSLSAAASALGVVYTDGIEQPVGTGRRGWCAIWEPATFRAKGFCALLSCR